MLHFLTMKFQNKIPLNIMPKDFPGGTVDGNLLATTILQLSSLLNIHTLGDNMPLPQSPWG